MDERTGAELRSLRARAYGPGEGLSGDPEALERLQELEALALQERAPEDASFAGPAPQSGAVEPATDTFAGVDADELVVTEESEPPESEASAPRLWWTPRRLAVVGAFVLVAVIVAAATVSAAFTYRLQADPREVAVLQVDPGLDWPEYYGGSIRDGAVFEPFYGLLALSQGGFGPPEARIECLQIADASIMDATGGGFQGVSYGGCGAGAFPPSTSMVVEASSPDELRERFADGTSLQFTLRGTEVVVLAVPPGPDPEESVAPE